MKFSKTLGGGQLKFEKFQHFGSDRITEGIYSTFESAVRSRSTLSEK